MFTVTIIASLGAAQGLMMSLAVLAIDRGNRIPNRLLAAFILILSIRLFVMAIEYSNQYAYADLHALLHLSYTIGPLIYFYLCALVQPHWKFSLTHLLHFSPAVFAVLLLTPEGPIFDLKASYYASQGFEHLPHAFKMRVAIVSMPVYVSLLAYSLLSLRVLRQHQMITPIHFSSLGPVNLNWVKSLLYFCLLFGVLGLIAQIYIVASGSVETPRAIHSVIVSVILIYYMGLMGIRQPQIFAKGESDNLSLDNLSIDTLAHDNQTDVEESNGERGETEDKYQRSGLTDDYVESLWRKLEQLMKEQRPYLQPSLKLADLAKMLGTRPNYLSQVVNGQTKQNFYDYINHHRIDHAKALLCDQNGKSVLNIALEVGYNSSSVLNRHFKSQTGLTPTKYRKEKAHKVPNHGK